jgi:hypothetical protein
LSILDPVDSSTGPIAIHADDDVDIGNVARPFHFPEVPDGGGFQLRILGRCHVDHHGPFLLVHDSSRTTHAAARASASNANDGGS